jgi:hypothetical protein
MKVMKSGLCPLMKKNLQGTTPSLQAVRDRFKKEFALVILRAKVSNKHPMEGWKLLFNCFDFLFVFYGFLIFLCTPWTRLNSRPILMQHSTPHTSTSTTAITSMMVAIPKTARTHTTNPPSLILVMLLISLSWDDEEAG